MELIARLCRSRSLLLAGVVLAGVGALGAAANNCGNWGPPDDTALKDELRRADELEREREVIGQRIKEKVRISAQVRAGQLTLLQAAARFRALDRDLGAFPWAAFRRLNPGGTDEERHCREVIGWVAADMANAEPSRTREVCSALERELQLCLQRGPLCLPDELK
jgi:hypothetical protein